jgi:hypothetical protein
MSEMVQNLSSAREGLKGQLALSLAIFEENK